MSSNPLHQFGIHKIYDINVAGFDISFTNHSLWTVVSVLCMSLFLFIASSKPKMIPSRMQSLLEITVDFVRQLLKDTADDVEGKMLPFVFTLFLFILTLNVAGMIPGSYTATSQLLTTASLSISVILVVIAVGFYTQGLGFLKIFFPEGTPLFMAPIIILLEMIAFFARPITLAMRLGANMLAGHILIKIFATLMIMLFFGLPMGVNVVGVSIPVVLTAALMLLEFGVAIIQAYIFTILTCVYLHDALHGH